MKTVVIDTNILVRFLVKDDPGQFQIAQDILEKIEKGETRGQVPLLVVNELVWILEHYYKIPKKIFAPQIAQLLAIKNIKIPDTKKGLVLQLLDQMCQSHLDFTDLYLLATAGINQIATFDKDLLKQS